MHRGAALVLVLALLAPLGAAEGDLRILASTYRVDLGVLEPGDTRTGEIGLANPGYEPVTVRLAHEGQTILVDTPAEIVVPPAQGATLRFVAHVPSDAAPGFHGEAIKLVPRAAETQQGVGTLQAGTAIVFTWRVAAVAVTAIEAPPIVLPGENVTGALVVVSTWPKSVVADVRLEWRDPTGAVVQSARIGPLEVQANGSARADYALPAAVSAAGVQKLVARVTDAGGAPIGAASEQPFSLGRKEAVVALAGVEDLRDGNASVTVDVENTGDVPTTVVPRVRVRAADGTERWVSLPSVSLAPGERRRVEGTLALAAGAFQLDVEADGATPAVRPAADGVDPGAFVMSAPDDGRLPLLPLVLFALAGAVAFATVALLAVRLRRALRWPRAPRSAKPVAAPAAPDAFDALFTQLDAPRVVAGCALLVDVDSLGPGVGLFQLARGRAVDVAYAYARAGSATSASEVAAALAKLGFVPRVLVDADDFRIEISLDAALEARAGRPVVLATGDPAFARLALALEKDGATVEVVRLARRIPVLDHSRSLAATRPST